MTYYNENRAVQAAAIFAKLEGGTIDKYKLAKLMYYLERETIVRTGQPLFHDALFSAPYVPVASGVNHGIDAIVPPKISNRDFEKGEHPAWENNFTRKGETSLLRTADPGSEELSESDINLINEIQQKFKNWDFNELKNFFHDLPEYVETDAKIPIHFTEILRAEGASEEEIKELKAEYYYFLGVSQHT